MINIKQIAESIPETPEERDDPNAHIVRLGAEGFGTMLDPFLTQDYCGCFRLRRAFKILQKVKELGGKNYYMHP